MNVQQLIERLKQLPQDAPVAIGRNEVLVVQPKRVILVGEQEPREVVQLDWFPF